MLRAAVDDGLIVTNPAETLGRQLRLVTSKATEGKPSASPYAALFTAYLCQFDAAAR
jgi:hypothetical protein